MRKQDKQNRKITVEVTQEMYSLLKAVQQEVKQNKGKLVRLGDILQAMVDEEKITNQ